MRALSLLDCRYVPAWANTQVPKTVDMFLSGIGRTGMRYVPVASAIILRINGDVNGKTEIIEIERT